MKPVTLRDVEIRHLQALEAVATEGSFGRAADRLGFSQSAVSQQIAAFERLVGASLFDRPGGPRRVELTPIGRAMLQHAEAVLARMRQAEEELEKLRAGTGGRLVLGTFQSTSVKILPAVVGRLRAERPELVLRVVEDDQNEDLAQRLIDGELDLTFLVGTFENDEIEQIELMRDRFVLISQSGAPVGAAPIADLRKEPLIGQQPNSCQFMIDNGLRAKGVEPDYVFRSNDNSAVQAMVRAGMGNAVMPYLAIDSNDPGIVVRELQPPLPPRVITLATRRGRTLLPAAQRFIELAREVCAEIAEPVTSAA